MTFLMDKIDMRGFPNVAPNMVLNQISKKIQNKHGILEF